MRLIWYNRDEFSDQDLAQAKAVSNRIQGVKDNNPWISNISYHDYFKNVDWFPAPQWAKDAKEYDVRREAV